jgi:hypothetical protein
VDPKGDLAAIGDQDLIKHGSFDDRQGFAIFDRLTILDE